MTVRNRAELTEQTLVDLFKNTRVPFDLYVFDNESDRELPALLVLYAEYILARKIAFLAMNRPPAIVDERPVPWSKSFALRQFLGLMRPLPASEKRYIVILDNDVLLRPGWLTKSIRVLESPEAGAQRITVACPYDDTNHPTLATVDLADHEVLLKTVSGACGWVTTWNFFERHGDPDIFFEGNGHEEGCYVARMHAAGERFGCFADPPLLSHERGVRCSERETRQALADRSWPAPSPLRP